MIVNHYTTDVIATEQNLKYFHLQEFYNLALDDNESTAVLKMLIRDEQDKHKYTEVSDFEKNLIMCNIADTPENQLVGHVRSGKSSIMLALLQKDGLLPLSFNFAEFEKIVNSDTEKFKTCYELLSRNKRKLGDDEK